MRRSYYDAERFPWGNVTLLWVYFSTLTMIA